MKWVALFSQTGSEVLEVSKLLNIRPNLIFTNQALHSSNINSELKHASIKTMYSTPSKPDVHDYHFMFAGADIITLHGWLRIIPPTVCNTYNIYNGHPGLITEYPELKGKDPQIRAWEGKYSDIGCVIHKVIPEVDAGAVILSNKISNKYKTLNEMYIALHDLSVNLWYTFLIEKLKKV